MSQSPQPNSFPSPEATTSAILGASSAGWSPVRTAKRPILSERDSLSSNHNDSESGKGGPQVPSHRANIAVLRSHGLVSNSIFKSGNPSPTNSQPSPLANHTRPSPDHRRNHQDGRMGVGLGISANSYSPTKGSMARNTSSSSFGSTHSISDTENDETSSPARNLFKASPRKSQGFKKLEKASYVSNSPFRRNGSSPDEQEKPLSLPNNAWAVSATAAAKSSPESPKRERPEKVGGVPRTPERTPQRLATAYGSGDPDFGTPTSQGTPRGARSESPSKGGLLVSNRLHGPRMMETNSATASPQDSPTRRERRKTVTFDEILDVQEFDRESSFDGHSLQSGSSQASSLNGLDATVARSASEEEEAMWLDGGASKVVQKLMVVNGTPDTASSAFSTPDLAENSELPNLDRQHFQNHHHHQRQGSDQVDSSSNDSRDLSSIDEPQSPPPGDFSFEQQEHGDKTFDKTFATAPDVSFYNESVYVDQESDLSGGNLSAYGALHRVESLVDELLEGDLLGKQSVSEDSPARRERSVSPPRRRRAAGPTLGEQQERGKPLPTLPHQPLPQASSQVELSLPAWSPLMPLDPSSESAATSVVPKQGRKPIEDDDEVEAELQVEALKKHVTPMPTVKSRATSRPHISRDAVLQRVAREKKMQEEQQQQQQQQKARNLSNDSKEEGVPQAKSHNALLVRRSEGGDGRVRSASGAIIANKIELPAQAVIPLPLTASAVPAPSPTKQVAHADLESPLERLTAEVAAAEQSQAAKQSETLVQKNMESDTESTRRQQTWFEERPDAKHLQVLDEQSDSGASGRLSPSLLGNPPPKLTPAQQAEQIIARRRSKNGKSHYRPRGRRSLSEGAESHEGSPEEAIDEQLVPVERDNNDAELREEELLRNRHMLDASLKGAIDSGFERGLEREISRIYRQGDQKYKINDRGAFTSGEEKVAHNTRAGDVDSGKAWRRLRRPSDMNEYAKEMREYRENENPKKAAGKVFVLVDSFTPSSLPVPSKPTRFYCVLDNGLHVVKTATAPLRPGVGSASKIGQEFELIQHRNLEFNLTLVVQRDTHLQEPRPESPTTTRKMTPSFSRGMGKLFSSPKKKAAFAASASMASTSGTMVEPMMSYINKEGAFGRCDVVFEKVAQQCLARCHTIDLPVQGVNEPAPSLSSSLYKTNSVDFSKNLGKIRGTLRLKLFYLPPMPSVPRNLMPQNLGDCIRGMEAARWHAGEAWMEGTLTQLGGDCVSWRRRPVKAQGAHLIGYNEITKKPTIKIDLSKAVAIEQSHDPVNDPNGTSYTMDDEEKDETYHVERSFRITFKDGEKIYYFADTDEEMKKWLMALRKVIGNGQIPANCVWASVAMEMIKSAREKNDSMKSTSTLSGGSTSNGAIATPSTSSSSNNSKRVPVRTDAVTPRNQSQQRVSSVTPSQRGPSLSSSSQSQSQAGMKASLQSMGQSGLSAVEESTNTPEQTPTRRPPRPASAYVPQQTPNSRRSAERPASVYVDGRS